MSVSVKLTIPPRRGERLTDSQIRAGAAVKHAGRHIGTVTGGRATPDGGLVLDAEIDEGNFDLFVSGVKRDAVSVEVRDAPLPAPNRGRGGARDGGVT